MRIIFTDHARARIRKRRMSLTGVEKTIENPDRKKTLSDGQTKFVKFLDNRLYQVIAVYKSDQKAWIVISAWIRGEEDQPDLIWRLITAPFKLLAKLWRWLWHLLFH
ncbi:MAG: DUF4258 domain-containing protein [bacterium]|nr:DUF4258 domain-containing protein [bacterium]